MQKKSAFLILTIFILFSFVISNLITIPSSHAKGAKRVAVLPFAMHAERDLGFLREGILDMLASRLYWKDKVEVIEKGLVKNAMGDHKGPINAEFARELGRKLQSDYVLFGSLTIFGESVSMDATMANVTRDEPPVTVFVQTKGTEAVIPEINKFAQKVNAKIFGRTYADTEFAYAPQASATGGAADRGASPLNPEFKKYDQVDLQGTSFWRSKAFNTEIRGMDIGDVDGDGQNEVVLLEGIDLTVYRYQNGALQKLATHRSSDRYPFLAVDVADINGNGRAEIFASRLSGTSVTSAVLEMEGSQLKPLVKHSPWFFRVTSWPGRGRILLGQQKAIGSIGGYANLIRDYFEKGIFALSWNGSTYAKSEEAPLLDLPSVFVYNFAIGDLTGDKVPEIVMIDRNQLLHILDNKGEELHKTSDYFGGTLNFIATNPAPSEASEAKLDEQWLFIPARIVITDLDNNGRNEIIINQNLSSTGGFTERFRAFSDGKIVSLSWSGVSLDTNWESRKLSGCLSDYQVKDLDNDGKIDLSVSSIQERGASVFKRARSVVISYKLKRE